jgi:hypothetical protein
MLFGYPSALTHIARHAEKRGVAMNDLGIRVAFVTSERLYDDQRATISRVFGCRVANGYGGRDAGFIAHECPSGGMHLTAEDIIVELVDAQGQPVPDGSPGEIVVTHLARAISRSCATAPATSPCSTPRLRLRPRPADAQGDPGPHHRLRRRCRRHRDARAGADLHPARPAGPGVVQGRAGDARAHPRVQLVAGPGFDRGRQADIVNVASSGAWARRWRCWSSSSTTSRPRSPASSATS